MWQIIIEESKDLFTIEFDKLIRSLMSHEERLRESVFGLEEKALSSKQDETSSSGKDRVDKAKEEEEAIEEVVLLA